MTLGRSGAPKPPKPAARAVDVGTSSAGFLKVSADSGTVTREQRAALIRKGNEFFNRKEYALAKRIFMTVGYSDGLIRMGDHFMKQNEPLEALRMYWLAGDRFHIDRITERMAAVIRRWIRE